MTYLQCFSGRLSVLLTAHVHGLRCCRVLRQLRWLHILIVVLPILLTGCSSLSAHKPEAKILPDKTQVLSVPRVYMNGKGAHFEDIAKKAGLDYRWDIPGPRPLDILQTIGNGCAFLDYDNDGNLDILLVGASLALFHGDGHGHFTNVTARMGLSKLKGHFLGCAVGDYDNDGFDDIYISGYRTGLLLRNVKGKRFEDVTRQAGLGPQPWGTSCAFADVDGDGKLDLYVANYADFDPLASQRLCPDRGVQSSCSPTKYRGIKGVLFHNENGRFRDVNPTWGTTGWGRTLGAAFGDYNGSGRPSLALANDELPGEFLRNEGHKFTNIWRQSGFAWDSRNKTHGGMGIDWGDYDNDGRPDIAASAFYTEPKSVFHNEEGMSFTDRSPAMGLAEPTLPYVAFGIKWLDYDNDGWLDLMIANGHVQDNIAQIDSAATYREPTQLFHNEKGKHFTDVSGGAGEALSRVIIGRGLAVGDFDNDGRVDALIVDSDGAPLLLHNQSEHCGHWLSFTLEGVKSNRDGIGAEITVQTALGKQTRVCHTDGSYLSSSDRRVHVGLGNATEAKDVRVRWPDGHVDRYARVAADRVYHVREGSARLR